MEYAIGDVTAEFFQSTIGILLSTVLLIAALIPGVKFLSKKFDERTDARIDAKLQPIVKALCNQVSEVTSAMRIQQVATTEAIKSLQSAQEFLQDLISGKQNNAKI